MITEIGITAGEILSYLDQKNTVALDEITGDIDQPPRLILMSLGWLARESHVQVFVKKNKFFVSLKKKKKLTACQQ